MNKEKENHICNGKRDELEEILLRMHEAKEKLIQLMETEKEVPSLLKEKGDIECAEYVCMMLDSSLKMLEKAISHIANLKSHYQDMENDTPAMKINTPAGILLAEKKGTWDEYPGFYISVESGDGETREIACVEYNTIKGCLQVLAYDKGEDSPSDIIEIRRGI